MRSLLFIFIFFLAANCAPAQQLPDSALAIDYSHIPDQQAKAAVYRIVRYTGLVANFTIIQADVPTAVAYIKGKQRYIAYSENFMRSVTDATKTDWAATSILAHEIGHHLLGHTIKAKGSNPGDELMADRFSGFILFQMGATLAEAQAAIETLDSTKSSKQHPPRSARHTAIANGWHEAQKLRGAVAQSPSANEETSVQRADIRYECTFLGDENIYYVDSRDNIIWFDNTGYPIVIGHRSESTVNKYQWMYHYADLIYGVDSRGRIWIDPAHELTFVVGQVYSYAELHGTETDP